MVRVSAGLGLFFKNRSGDLKISGHMEFWARFRGMMSNFRSDDSFPVKTGSRPTEMVNPSFDAEYPTYPRVLPVLDL